MKSKSTQHTVHHMSVYVSESSLDAVMVKSEPLVVEAEEVHLIQELLRLYQSNRHNLNQLLLDKSIKFIKLN